MFVSRIIAKDSFQQERAYSPPCFSDQRMIKHGGKLIVKVQK